MSSKYADKQWQEKLFQYCKDDNVAALRKELFPTGELVVPQDLSEAKFQKWDGEQYKLLVSTSADLIEGNELSEFLKVFKGFADDVSRYALPKTLCKPSWKNAKPHYRIWWNRDLHARQMH